MEALAGTETFDYVLRYRWNRDTAKGVAIGVVFGALIALIPAPLWARILVIGTCGLFVVLLLVPSVLRTTCLRLDESGVLIRRSWLRPHRAECYPWSTVEAIAIWKSRTNLTVAVQCREGATPLVKPPRGFQQRLVGAAAPGVPPDIAVTGVSITARLVNIAKLLAAVDHFAPSVHVIDVSGGRLLRQGRPA